MEPKNQDLKREKNGITNVENCYRFHLGSCYDGEGPIFRKVSEAFCVSIDKMIQILIIIYKSCTRLKIFHIWNCTRKSWVIAIAQQDLALTKEITDLPLRYYVVLYFFKNESVYVVLYYLRMNPLRYYVVLYFLRMNPFMWFFII
ncbi:unnamed protein product [Rhizophagus irregularis]|nr:unnamed protein product [Rhizophagus irregularis]